MKDVKLLLLLGLLFFSAITVLSIVKYTRTRKGFVKTLAGLVMVFLTAVIYFEIYALLMPALIAFFLMSVYAIIDIFTGKTLPEEIAEELERIEREPKWHDILTWKPLLILRDKFGNTVASVIYSAFMSVSGIVGFFALATVFELPVSMATVGALAMTMFVIYGLSIHRALKRLEIKG